LAVSQAGPDTTALTPGSLRDFAVRYLAAWNEHDAGRMTDLLTEDIVWSDPALPEPARGVAAVQEFMRSSWQAFPDLRFEEPDPPHFSVNGDYVAWAWRMHGTMTGPLDPPGFAPTGKSMTVDGVDLWIFRGDRIAVYRAFYDLMDLSRQLGLMPPPGSRAEKATVVMQRFQARLQRR
jgi:steroid delta-isomerase-like uncharacterized protein